MANLNRLRSLEIEMQEIDAQIAEQKEVLRALRATWDTKLIDLREEIRKDPNQQALDFIQSKGKEPNDVSV